MKKQAVTVLCLIVNGEDPNMEENLREFEDALIESSMFLDFPCAVRLLHGTVWRGPDQSGREARVDLEPFEFLFLDEC